MEMNRLLIDIGIATILLLMGMFIKHCFSFTRKLLFPAGIIGAFIGLLLGPSVLNILPFSLSIESYPGVLVTLIFSILPLTMPSLCKNEFSMRIGGMFAYSVILYAAQWAIAIIFTLVVLQPIWKEIHLGIGVMLAAGFAGGHGTVSAVAEVFVARGWEDARSLGMTAATIGLIVAILGGIIFAQLGLRHNLSHQNQNITIANHEIGYHNEEERRLIFVRSLLYKILITIQPTSAVHFALNWGLVLSVSSLAIFVAAIMEILCGKAVMPAFCLAFLIGYFVRKLFNITNNSRYISIQAMTRLNTIATDFIIIFGISPIHVEVVLQYVAPLILLVIVAITYSAAFYWILARKFFRDHWFEKGLFSWGWATGTVAMGIILLRIVDPTFKSKTLEDYGMAYVPIAPFDLTTITWAPILVANGHPWLFVFSCTLVCISVFLVAKRSCWVP